MRCEHCGKNEATFYYKSNINGRVTEKHLCQECAARQGYTRSFRPMRLLDDDFFLQPFGMLQSLNRMLTEFPAPQEEAEAPQHHGSGLLDEEEQKKLMQQRRKNALEAQLKDAVEREDFESAIRLRDELKELRG